MDLEQHYRIFWCSKMCAIFRSHFFTKWVFFRCFWLYSRVQPFDDIATFSLDSQVSPHIVLRHHSRVKTDLFNQSPSTQRGLISTSPDNPTLPCTIFRSWRWLKLYSQPDRPSVQWRFIQVQKWNDWNINNNEFKKTCFFLFFIV